MSRPKKYTVDYFPHYCNHKKTVFILEDQFGNDGYSFWFKLLELLGKTEGHFYDYKTGASKLYLLSRAKVNEELGNKILDLLADLNAIDKTLWKKGIIWCQNFVDGLEDLYKRRKTDKPLKPTLTRKQANKCQQKPSNPDVSTVINPHSKLKETKLKKTKRTFIKPSIKEIKQYCIERKNNIDPEQFFDFYESKGWMVGKNKMKEWKACVRTWEKNSKQLASNLEPITVSAAITLIHRNQTTSTMEEILQRLPEKDLPEFMTFVDKDNYLKGIYQRAKKEKK